MTLHYILHFSTFFFLACLKTNAIFQSSSNHWLSVGVSPGSSSRLIDLYFDFVHAWRRGVIKQCDWNIQMTVLIEENKCSHMARLAVLSSAWGRVPKQPRPIWSWLSGDHEPTNTTAKPWPLLMPPGFHCIRITLHTHTHTHTHACMTQERRQRKGGSEERGHRRDGGRRWMKWVTA